MALTFHLLPHTHWDREWYLSQPVFGARLVAALDDLVDRLEREPGFRRFHLDGQTVLLEDYLRVRPEQRDRIVALARAGRLALGPWYVLTDELVPSGESLVRNLLLGRRDCRPFGGASPVLYSPDAFGHPGAWPALAAEFALPYGVLWRGLGGEEGARGDLFRWAATDGREILLHHLPPDGYEAGSALAGADEAIDAAWRQLRPALVDRATTSQVAVPVGADHHAAPLAIERVRARLAAREPGSAVRVSSWEEFFQAAAAELEGSAAAPALRTLCGELRWSYGYTWTLQGVHATRAPLKRRHAEAELWLERLAEPLVALAGYTGASDGRPVLREAWRALVRSQFHDSIGGCTSDAVARRVRARVEDAEAVARDLARVSLHALVGHAPDAARDRPGDTAPALVIWNPLPRRRAGSVVVADTTWFRRDVLVGPPGGRRPRRGPGARAFELRDGQSRYPVQSLGSFAAQERMDSARHYPDQDEVEVLRVAFRAPPLGGFGVAALRPAGPVGEPAGAVTAGARRLDNGLLTVDVGDDGTVTMLDRTTGQRYPGLIRLESSGDVGDTYTWCPPADDMLVRFAGPTAVRTLTRGPLVGALEVRGALVLASGPVAVRLVLTLHDGSAALRVTLELDNGAVNHRLRLRCPTGVRGGAAVAGAAFGAVARAPVDPALTARYPRERPVATAPAQRYVARADAARGLAMLSAGFFEYEYDAAGDLVLTVLRSVGELSRDDLATRPGHAGWPTATPEAQCLGPDRLQLALVPVDSAAVADGTTLPRLWEECFLPPQACWIRQATPLAPEPLDIRLEGEGLVFSALKPADEAPRGTNALVLRCWNARDAWVSGAWCFDRAIVRARRTRADEVLDGAGELPLEEEGRRVAFAAPPLGMVTVLVELEAAPSRG